jgi:hypothetical protein
LSENSRSSDDARRSEKRQGISRRQMVQLLTSGASGSLLAARGAIASSGSGASVDHAALFEEKAKKTAAESAPIFLDPHQKETLTTLAERIIPGSTKADAAGFVDLLLSEDTQENQKEFIASLSAMDGESLRRYGCPFKDLTEARQNEFLTIASTPTDGQASENESDAVAGSTGQPGLPLNVLNKHFESLKSWVSNAYYSSEVGMRELGWTDTYFFTNFTECEDEKS